MINPQEWHNCDSIIKNYILGFIKLLKEHLSEMLIGVYLHGSLAMGSYFPPKSDIDILAIVDNKLDCNIAKELNLMIVKYSNTRSTIGDIEFSIITSNTAKNIPSKIPYELHYSEAFHDKIINNQIEYGLEQFDTDLSAHIMCIKKRGICLLGKPISEVFGDVKWTDFMYAVLNDFHWLVENENICESPYYCILNICRVLNLIFEEKEECLSKYEGGKWGIRNLPNEFNLLIQKALDIYSSNDIIDNGVRKTGGVSWDKAELLSFRDYARKFATDSPLKE